MVSIALSAASATKIRFAVSCLWETLSGVRLLNAPGVPAIYRRWASGVALPADTLLAALVAPAGAYTPDFLTPPPAGLSADLDLELAALRATAPATVREHLGYMPALSPLLDALHRDPAAGLARLSDEIKAYWSTAVAPDWPRMHALLAAEIQRQANRLATEGAAAVLSDLHPQVKWQNGILTINQPHCTAPDVPAGAGVILIPSIFAWPAVLTVSAGPMPQLAYPPPGVATLWEPATTPSEALTTLLGRGRARLLLELTSPLSTTDLAHRTGITPGGISHHLATLRATGLVTTHRAGRRLLNTRTPLAESLLTAASSG
ncbi:winged helix-turn-helix domain-containing protein [Actinoplanes bogorensis]|uniref:Winged helix-turn-helix domain-containing protein n=1 Tax=Paractinoplanes bogorensis TaxID=1610840 RepID=A0ABS5YGU8_9ACTN|nr:DUF5937 family protein [Actinoplanes bogorensis]MBU2661923.1 winged helix-turn-helix domain-containing protein [Actinoplanes bogorensis]